MPLHGQEGGARTIALTVERWDRRFAILTVKIDKANAGRRFRVLAAVAAFPNEQCRSKLPAAPVFTDAQGRLWDRLKWKREVATAVAAAGFPPATGPLDAITAYTLRHSLLTEMVEAGSPLAVIAEIAGTSLAQLTETSLHPASRSPSGRASIVPRLA